MDLWDTKWLEAVFTDGTLVEVDNIEYQFYTKELGSLNIPTGNIVACDPIILYEDTPFQTQFPIGAFPVELAVMFMNGAGENSEPDERIAFARIVFSDNPVLYWKLAVCEDSDASELSDDKFFGYVVDAGTGCFMDKLACEQLKEMYDGDAAAFDSMWGQLEASYKHTRCWLLKDLGDGLNVAAFSTGLGDGVYPTYIGYDKKGAIARLTTDFGCIGEL